MHLATIRTLPELASLENEWDNLSAVSASHVPFLRHEYIIAWWQGLGGGEWSHGELCVVTARDDQARLVGIAPLFITDNREGEPALMLLGSIEISDYLDIIARQQDIPAFMEALLTYLASQSLTAAGLLDWHNVLESSPTLPALQAAAQKLGWSYSQQPLQHCPYIPLPADWERYLSGIDKKQRHEIRRKMRRAKEYYLPVRWYFCQDGSTLERDMDDFMQLMSYDADKSKFLTPEMRKQLQAIAQAAHRAGWLQLSFIEVNGQRAAGYLNFDYMNHIWVYNSGFDLQFSELSLGWVLLGNLLQWAIENGRQCFDFMRGDEQYKYRFGAIDRLVMRLQVRK